jgi:hypothetical protein
MPVSKMYKSVSDDHTDAEEENISQFRPRIGSTGRFPNQFHGYQIGIRISRVAAMETRRRCTQPLSDSREDDQIVRWCQDRRTCICWLSFCVHEHILVVRRQAQEKRHRPAQ